METIVEDKVTPRYLNGPIKKALPYEPVSAFRQLSRLHPKDFGKRLPGKRFPKYTRKNQLCQEV
jgi:hypothetical protein